MTAQALVILSISQMRQRSMSGLGSPSELSAGLGPRALDPPSRVTRNHPRPGLSCAVPTPLSNLPHPCGSCRICLQRDF